MKTLKVDLIAIKLVECVVKTALLQSCTSMYFIFFLALVKFLNFPVLAWSLYSYFEAFTYHSQEKKTLYNYINS